MMDKNKAHNDACQNDERQESKEDTNSKATDERKDSEPSGKAWQINENTTDSFSEKAQKPKTGQSDKEA